MIGRTLAHYEILEKIGSGGMGDVYLAEDTKLSRKVALKVLPPELAESEERRERFEREARAIAALDHPNIVQVFSVEQAEGVHFITMQLVQGKTLTELLPKTGFPLTQFFDVAIPLAEAVSAAHQEGITHRDLKPDNVMMSDDGRVKVLDFGLAKSEAGFALGDAGSEFPTQAKTREGTILGTPSYMSPEQVEGKPVDHRSDIFSLGIMFYEMLSGRRPFTGDTAAAALSSIMKDTPPVVAEIQSGVPDRLSTMVQRCLSKDPARRVQSIDELRSELQELRTQPATSRPVAPRLVAAAAVALVTVGIWSFLPRGSDDSVVRLSNPVQITSAIGVEDFPSWSPDGRTLAYASETRGFEDGNWDIWVNSNRIR